MVLGVVLFIAPFAVGATASQATAWTAYAGGALLAIAGLWSVFKSSPVNHFAEWAEIVIGVLVFLAPWVLGFTGVTALGTVTLKRGSGHVGGPSKDLTHGYTITLPTQRAG